MSKDTSYCIGAKYIKYAKFFMLYLYLEKTSLSIQNLMYLAHLEQERMQITVARLTEIIRVTGVLRICARCQYASRVYI
jgi:hypothetical protein